MKLVIAVVQDKDSLQLINALNAENFKTTKLATTGGFLKEGNTTLMIGCREEHVEEVLEIIKHNCSERESTISPIPPIDVDSYSPKPVNVEIGGATVFVLPIESFYRF